MLSESTGVRRRRRRERAPLRLLVPVLALSLLPRLARGQDPALPEADGGPVVTAIRVEGLEHHAEQAVTAALAQEVGQAFDRSRFDEGIRTLWNNYKILVSSMELAQAPGGVELIVRVREMPVDHEPRFVGNASIDEATLRQWGGLEDKAELYLHEAERVRQRLIEGYRRKGYHFVEVQVVSQGGEADPEGVPDVIFEIREGPRVRSLGIEVRGNHSLPDTGWGFWRGGLKALAKVETKGRGLLRWFGKPFVEEALKADLVAMRQVYRDRGWLDAKVEIEELEFNEERTRVRVHVLVDEGPLYTVASISIRGMERVSGEDLSEVPLIFPEEELLAQLEMQPGTPYELGRLVHDRRALRDYYGERGYLERAVFVDREGVEGWEFLEPSVVEDVERHEVVLVYRLIQGRRRFVREVRFAGNAHTRDRVLRREAGILPGDVANIREIDATRARIAGTGYFSDPRDLMHREPYYVFHQTEDPDLVDVEYRVGEGRVVDFQLAGGVASDSGVVGLISLRMTNFDIDNAPSGLASAFGEIYRKEAFHGDGETLQLDLSPGSEISFFRGRYHHPDIFGRHFDPYSFDAQGQIRERIFRSHDEDRRSIDMTLGRLFGRRFSAGVGPIWQEIEIGDLDEGPVPSTLADSEGESSFQGVELDLRYNGLDNRYAPRNGVWASLQNTVFGGALGGDNDVLKTELFLDWYRELGRDADVDDANPGLYFGFGAGVSHPYGDTEFVNYGERFFYGGSSTLRGFDFRGVGPNEGDFALGGETGVRATLEYRHPLYTVPEPGSSRRREFLRGFVFADAGVLDPGSWSLDLDETRASVGFGFGLIHPIPLTFNFGFPVREGDGDDKEVFSFRLDFR